MGARKNEGLVWRCGQGPGHAKNHYGKLVESFKGVVDTFRFVFPFFLFLRFYFWGIPGWCSVWHLPLAQETWDRIPYQAPGAWSLLLPLSMSLPLSLSVTIINK